MKIINFLLCFLAFFAPKRCSFEYYCSGYTQVVSCTSDYLGHNCAALTNCCLRMSVRVNDYTQVVSTCYHCQMPAQIMSFRKYIRSNITGLICDCGQIGYIPAYTILGINVPASYTVICNNGCCGQISSSQSQINSNTKTSTGVIIGATIGGIIGATALITGIAWIIKKNIAQVFDQPQVQHLQEHSMQIQSSEIIMNNLK